MDVITAHELWESARHLVDKADELAVPVVAIEVTGWGGARVQVARSIKEVVRVARDKAADLGTRIHHQAEAHVIGAEVSPDPEAAPFVAQYLRFLEDFGVDSDPTSTTRPATPKGRAVPKSTRTRTRKAA